MKRTLTWTAILFAGWVAQAQQRIVPHVTRPEADFISQVIVANLTDLPKDYGFFAYDSQGSQVALVSDHVAGQATLFLDLESLFGTDEISHFLIESDSGVVVSIAYRADREVSGPAHLRETSTQSRAWRLYSGNPEVTWDGIAIVNLGSQPTDILVRQVEEHGNSLDSATAISGLTSNAKGLYLFADDFTHVAGSFYEIIADQPTAITALRGNQASDFLWENAAIPFVPAPSKTSYGVEDAFPNLGFLLAAVDLQDPGSGPDRLFAVLQEGMIRAFANDPQAQEVPIFLDIRDRVLSGGELGLLGLAFHPDFNENGWFFVNYTVGAPRRSRISRFQVNPGNPDLADPQSELVLLEVAQPRSNHNGGQLAFGPDGFLYGSFGDSGGGGDPDGDGQNRQTLRGSIFRIDVDNPGDGLNYGIPADNPFVGNAQNFREEIYAYGFRNPWRFSFDIGENGTALWVADVGQNRLEEIDIVVNGGNYGWNVVEGNSCFQPPNGCNTAGLIPPIWEYSHDAGDQSITGGFVYRGSRISTLMGAYIYADFISGRIWALQYDGQNPPVNTFLLQAPATTITSFGRDRYGEIYLCSLDGNIYRLVEN